MELIISEKINESKELDASDTQVPSEPSGMEMKDGVCLEESSGEQEEEKQEIVDFILKKTVSFREKDLVETRTFESFCDSCDSPPSVDTSKKGHVGKRLLWHGTAASHVEKLQGSARMARVSNGVHIKPVKQRFLSSEEKLVQNMQKPKLHFLMSMRGIAPSG